jgi:1,4-alpha-glucan branching enzyme
MKKFVLNLFLIPSLLFSQAIVSLPEFPTETDSIVITFNATQASNTALVGYTGILYTHTGVTTQIGTGAETKWQHVIGTWGDNTVQPSLTRISTNVYKLVIDNPRTFYGITNSLEHITELCFVFRSADGTKQSEDLFIKIYEKGLNVKIVEPAQLPTYPLEGEKLNLVAVTNGADSLTLLLDNTKVASTITDTLKYTISESQIGRHSLKFVAYGNNETFTDSTHFFIRKNLTIEDLPSGIVPGINYIDDNTIILALYAPDKKFIYAIGDFNNWEFDPDSSASWNFDDKYYMKMTSDSTTFWTTITNLTPNKEYRFLYLVDGNLQIADPYSDKILEPDDSYISSVTYPNLIPYPKNISSYPVSVFQTAQNSYTWETTDYHKPDKTKLIIYELLVRDFVSTHNYKTLTDTLDYFTKLGINAIELMPINEFEGNDSWGYNPSFYFAPDKYYGPKNDLKKFIDECHKRDIAVIMDMVLNHSYGRSSFVRLYASGPFGPPTQENPWYNVTSPNPVYSWGADFNHQSKQTQKLVDRINRYWIREYNIDGFRYDFTKGFTNTPGDGSNYDQSRINILKRMADSIWAFDSTTYIILEHFTADTEEKVLTDYGMMVWGNNNYSYNEATMGYNESSKSDFNRISYLNHSFTKPHLVGYMESHDEERLMYKNLQYGNSNGSYNVKSLNTALQRIKLAAAFFIPVPGPKMIWQFGELGYDYTIDYNGRVGTKPIRWDYYSEIVRLNLFKTYAALNFLKTNYKTFSTNDFALATTSYVKRIKLNNDSMNAVIIGNFDVIERSIIPSFQETGEWYDYFSGDSLDITDTQININLAPGEFHIFTSKKIPTPEPDILLGLEENINALPLQFSLNQNYPNPFNPTTTIKYSVANVASDFSLRTVTIKVYDILGREVATLVNEKQSAGNYEVNFNANNLSSGIYYYRLTFGNYVQTKKMILIK